jgi:hypothetical protein
VWQYGTSAPTRPPASHGPWLQERVCCLLVLDSVTSTHQWIRQPKPSDVVHNVCGFVCECVLGSPGVLGLIPKREEPGKTGQHPVLFYQVPHGSQPRLGWAPDPCWAGGWACTSHPGVLGLIPKREEPGKTEGLPVLIYRVPHGSQPSPGWAPDPLMVGIRSPDGLVVGLAPDTLEFWFRFPNERNQGKQGNTQC